MTVTRSGFPWSDEPFRYLAYTTTHYAFAPTPERAAADLADLIEQEPTPTLF